MNNENEVQCDDCGWEGMMTELNGVECPECGSDEIDDLEDSGDDY